MTILGINPQSPTTPIGTPPDYQAVASLRYDVSRLDQRLTSVEATRTVIGDNSIGSSEVAPASIDGTHIAPASITTAMIVAGSIDATSINAASVAAAVGTFVSINASQIVAGNILAARMQANVIAAVQATVSSLSAITSNMGSITAGTITGATFQTSAAGNRVVMDTNGIHGYIGGTTVFDINAGSGVATFTGVIQANAGSVIPGSTIPTGTLPGTAIASSSVTTLQLAAGSVAANTIAAGAIQTQHIGFTFGGSNRLENAAFAYWPTAATNPDGSTNPGFAFADSPGYWAHYDNGGTGGTATWSKVALATPEGRNAWRLVTTAAVTAAKGFQSWWPQYRAPNGSYVISFQWKGNSVPVINSNGNITSYQWIDTLGKDIPGATSSQSPTAPSATAFTDYAVRITYNATGGPGNWDAAAGSSGGPNATPGWDFLYIYPAAEFTAAVDVQIARPQFEPGQVKSQWAPKPGEVLPGSVGNTQIGPDAITTDKILAGTILAGDMTVSTLSAITANLGTVTAGTITGATVQTAASGARTVIDSAGLHVYDSGGAQVFQAAGGAVAMTGSLTSTGMYFVNATGGIATTNTIYWYAGFFAQEVGHDTVYYSGTTTVNERQIQIPTGTGIAEWRVKANNSSSGESLYLSLQHNSSNYDQFVVYHKATTAAATRNLFQVIELGDITMWYPPLSGVSSMLWMNTSVYMRVREDYGFRFDNGGFNTEVYGGSGAAHVCIAAVSGSPSNLTYTSGYSYAVLHQNTSDRKYKYHIRDADDRAALSKIRALRPRQHAWKGGHRTGHQDRGFIAQEVQEVFPDAVERLIDPDGTIEYALNPTALIAGLVSAVQELSEAVNILRGEKPNAPLSRDNVASIK